MTKSANTEGREALNRGTGTTGAGRLGLGIAPETETITADAATPTNARGAATDHDPTTIQPHSKFPIILNMPIGNSATLPTCTQPQLQLQLKS